jgi:alcohol dehydrogenase
MTQTIYIDDGAAARLTEALDALGAERLLLVTGRGSFEASGAAAAIAPALTGRAVTRSFDFAVNPKSEDVAQGVALMQRARAQVVLAVGGGSVMDMAKLVAYFSAAALTPAAYAAGERPPAVRPAPVVAVPTTSGSGAEATPFAVMYHEGVKLSVVHPEILPRVAVVDHALKRSMPPALAAASGMDALAQGVESYWNVRADEASTPLAREAMGLVAAHLRGAALDGDPDAVAAVSRGAFLAGQAIALTTTTACHAVSYPITSLFGLPHGHAVGLLLAPMLAFNHGVDDDRVTDPRGAAYVRRRLDEIAQALGAVSVPEATQWLRDLMDDLGLARTLPAVGVRTPEDVERIVAGGFNPQRMVNNPRHVSADDLRGVLAGLMHD